MGEGREGFEGEGAAAQRGLLRLRIALPGDCHQGPGRLGQPRPPALNSPGIGLQMGVAVDGRLRGHPEHPRQGEQRQPGPVPVLGGLRGAEGIGVEAGAAEQAMQLRLGAEAHGQAGPAQGQQIAGELKGVAQALFGHQQQLLAGRQGGVPVPTGGAGPGQEPPGRPGDGVTPFVLLPALRVVPLQQQQHAQVCVGLGEGGPLGDRLSIAGLSPLQIPLFLQRCAQVAARVDIGRC